MMAFGDKSVVTHCLSLVLAPLYVFVCCTLWTFTDTTHCISGTLTFGHLLFQVLSVIHQESTLHVIARKCIRHCYNKQFGRSPGTALACVLMHLVSDWLKFRVRTQGVHALRYSDLD